MQKILSTFKSYQKARVDFVQSVAQLALREQHVDLMENAGVMKLLNPLLLDNVPSIQMTAALALGRLAAHSQVIAKNVIDSGSVAHLIRTLVHDSPHARKASAFVVRSIAKHSSALAESVVKEGVLEPLRNCLDHVDPGVKESGAWALDYICKHDMNLAQAVVDAGVIKLLALCLEEPEQTLKRIAATTLGDIAKHSPKLAQLVVDAGVLDSFQMLLKLNDPSLLRQVCACIAQVAKHSVELADQVVRHEVMGRVLDCIKSANVSVQHNALVCVREIVKRSSKHCKLVVDSGGIKHVIDVVRDDQSGTLWLPGAMVLGYVAGHDAEYASKIIDLRGIVVLKTLLADRQIGNDEGRAAIAWAFGEIGKHSSTHAKPMGEEKVYEELVALSEAKISSKDLKSKARGALKVLISTCADMRTLEPLLRDSSPEVIKYTLEQFAVILPNSVEMKRNFVESGSLRYVQEMNRDDVDHELVDLVAKIRRCFPQEVSDYYAPGNDDKILTRHFGS